jgi:hypothetical protein
MWMTRYGGNDIKSSVEIRCVIERINHSSSSNTNLGVRLETRMGRLRRQGRTSEGALHVEQIGSGEPVTGSSQ